MKRTIFTATGGILILLILAAVAAAIEASQPAQPESVGVRETSDARSTAASAAVAAPQDAANRQLAAKVRRVLDAYYLRPLNTRDDAPWSVLHWSIAYGVDAMVSVGKPDGQRVTAIGWLCANYPSAGLRLAAPHDEGFALPVAPGIQGHDGQFLSMLAQSQVKEDYLFHVGQQKLTVADLVDYEKRTCRRDMELTFKLIGIAFYEDTEAVWRNARGEEWSVRRLLEEELSQPVSRMQTCGGLHRLFAIHYAVDRRLREGKPLDGPFQQAQLKTAAYQRRALAMQDADGGFSTAWLDQRENRGDVTRHLTTSGHILEYLAYSLPQEKLGDPQFERAVDYVATLLEGKQEAAWHRGALGHALHALVIYEQRALGGRPGLRSERLADAGDRPTSTK